MCEREREMKRGGRGRYGENKKVLNLFSEMPNFPLGQYVWQSITSWCPRSSSLVRSSGVDTGLWPPGRQCVRAKSPALESY